VALIRQLQQKHRDQAHHLYKNKITS